MNVVELVQKIGKNYGLDVSEEKAEYVLWNHTGFPCFFEKEGTLEEVLTPQLEEFFRSASDPTP